MIKNQYVLSISKETRFCWGYYVYFIKVISNIENDFIYNFGCINFYVFRNWKNKGIAKPVK